MQELAFAREPSVLDLDPGILGDRGPVPGVYSADQGASS